MLAFSFFRCASLSPSLFSFVFSIPLKKEWETFYNKNDSENSTHNLGYIQCYNTDTFTKPKTTAIKFSMTTIFLKLISFMLKRPLQIPKYAYAKACSIRIKKKLI